jgi:hypothetical protein
MVIPSRLFFAFEAVVNRLIGWRTTGMVAMHAKEDAGTMLELTVTEFTVSVRAINPVSAKVLALLLLLASALLCSHAMGCGRWCCIALR